MAESVHRLGYQCEFKDSVHDNFYCKKCTLVSRRLTYTSCCGESYCHACITDIQQQDQPCLECGHQNFTTIKPLKYQRQMDCLNVYCSMRGRGCGWSGMLGQLDAHLDPDQNNCQHVDIKCPLNCQQTIPKNKLEEHVAMECVKRDYVCQYCDYKATYEVMVDTHWPECIYFPLQCPNFCGVTCERDVMEHHMRVCRRGEVACELSSMGCDARFEREEQEEHARKNYQKHLTMVAATSVKMNQQLHQKVLEKEEKLQEQEKKLQEQEEKLEEQNEKLQEWEEKMQEQEEKQQEQEEKLQELEEKVVEQEEKLLEQKDKLQEQEKKWQEQQEKLPELEEKLEEQKEKQQEQEEKLQELEEKLREKEEKLLEQEDKLQEQEKKRQEQQEKLPELEKKLQEQEKKLQEQIKEVTTFINLKRRFAMENFSIEKKKDMPHGWKSPVMYTHVCGYKFCVGIDANGYGDIHGKAIGAELWFMQGEYDHQLKWPAQANFTIELLNQHGGDNIIHTLKRVQWQKRTTTYEYIHSFAPIQYGIYWAFIEHAKLADFLDNDTLYFHLSNITVY